MAVSSGDYEIHGAEEEEEEPIMKISKMSDQQRKRLTLSPKFRNKLNAVFARKVVDVENQSKKEEKDRLKVSSQPYPPNQVERTKQDENGKSLPPGKPYPPKQVNRMESNSNASKIPDPPCPPSEENRMESKSDYNIKEVPGQSYPSEQMDRTEPGFKQDSKKSNYLNRVPGQSYPSNQVDRTEHRSKHKSVSGQPFPPSRENRRKCSSSHNTNPNQLHNSYHSVKRTEINKISGQPYPSRQVDRMGSHVFNKRHYKGHANSDQPFPPNTVNRTNLSRNKSSINQSNKHRLKQHYNKSFPNPDHPYPSSQTNRRGLQIHDQEFSLSDTSGQLYPSDVEDQTEWSSGEEFSDDYDTFADSDESFDTMNDVQKLDLPGFNINEGYDNIMMKNPLFRGVNWNNNSKLPISKWPIKYSGTDNGIGLNLFLRQVEFFAASEGMTKVDLFQAAHQLLVGPASIWFVTKWPILRRKNWDYFVQALRKQFLPSNIDHFVKVRSFSMSQGRNESFSNFLVRMEQFFLCRTKPLSEEEKFEIIWHTMRSNYRDKLGLFRVKTLKLLEDLCERIDANNESFMNRFNFAFDNRRINEVDYSITEQPFRHKNSNDSLFNSQYKYNNNNYNKNQSNFVNNKSFNKPTFNQNSKFSSNQYNRPTQTNQFVKNNSKFQSNNNNSSSSQQISNGKDWPSWRDMSKEDILEHYKIPDNTCFNCRKKGHNFTTCYFKRQVFCYICGLPDFHYEDCPYCEGKNRRKGN